MGNTRGGSLSIIKAGMAGVGFTLMAISVYYIFSDVLGIMAYRVAIVWGLTQFSLKHLVNKYWVYQTNQKVGA